MRKCVFMQSGARTEKAALQIALRILFSLYVELLHCISIYHNNNYFRALNAIRLPHKATALYKQTQSDLHNGNICDISVKTKSKPEDKD